MRPVPETRLSRALQTWLWIRRPTDLLDLGSVECGDLFAIRTYFYSRLIVVGGLEGIQRIFGSTYDQLDQRKGPAFGRFLGENSLFVLDGSPHGQMRHAVMPTLGPNQTKGQLQQLASLVDGAIDTWPIGTRFSMQETMQELLLRSTLLMLLGAAAPERMTQLARVFASTYREFSNPLMVGYLKQQEQYQVGPWPRLLQLSSQARALLTAELSDRRARRTKEGTDVLSLLIQTIHPTKRELSTDEICDSLIALFMAGHHTTANALSWTFYELLRDPMILHRLQQEVRQVWGSSEMPTEQVLSLPLLDATVREVLRLRPIFPVTTRTLRQPMEIQGFSIPANSIVLPAIYLAQRNPQAFPEPHRFLPDRFLGLRQAPAEWMPFGGGVRRCVGSSPVLMQMKVILATILRRISMRRVSGPPAQMVRAFISNAPTGGVPVVVTERLPRAARTEQPLATCPIAASA